MTTTPTPVPRIAGDRTGRHAPGRRSDLAPLLAPRSVAVAGAGWCHGGTAHEVLRGLRDYGFRGALYAVNPSGRPVCGVPGYRLVGDVPGPVDLLVVAAPADRTADVVAAAAGAGIRAAVVLSAPGARRAASGGSDRPEPGCLARRHGIRLIGPESAGVLITDPRVRLHAGLAAVRPAPGGLAVLVRSGAVGVAMLDQAARTGCGISGLVSLGDGGSVTPGEFLGHWRDDPATRVVALHLGLYDDPDRLAPAVRALARRKPVLTVGAGPPPATAPESGVLRTSGTEELVDAARMLDGQSLPAGDRLVIAGNAEGLTALAADTARAYGFRIVGLSAAARAELPSVNGAAGRDNPVDLGITASPALLADVVETVASHDEADVLLLIVVGTRANVPARMTSVLGRVVDDHPTLATAAVVTGAADDRATLGTRKVPVYRQPEQALRALAHARRYALWRRTAGGLPSATW